MCMGVLYIPIHHQQLLFHAYGNVWWSFGVIHTTTSVKFKLGPCTIYSAFAGITPEKPNAREPQASWSGTSLRNVDFTVGAARRNVSRKLSNCIGFN